MTTQVPLMSLKPIGAEVVAIDATGERVLSIGGSNVQLHKALVPAAGERVSLGAETAPFDSIHVRSIKGGVVFDGDVTFAKPPWPLPSSANTPNNVVPMSDMFVSANTSTNPVYTPV